MATLATPPERRQPTSPAPWRTSTGPVRAAGRPVKLLRWLTVALIAAGVLGRLVRYFLRFPIWGDEAFIAFNLFQRDFIGLTRGLEYSQVAPVLFLWGELAVTRLLGISELAMRLLPLLAGLASLALFWRLARSTVPPLAALIAVGLLAVARTPISMSTFVKPYSYDLLMALALIVPAVEWLRRPQQLRWLVVLALAAPVALLSSYPAVFIAGAVSLALLPAAWRSGWAGRGLFAAYNLLAAAAFLASYWIVGHEQLDPVHGSVNAYLQAYWAEAFPPSSPWQLARWLAEMNTSQVMGYPFDLGRFGGVATFLLFAVGVWTWWKGGRRSLLVAAEGKRPIPAATTLAAFLHRYPYGISRLSQHLAPAACLLAGTGAAALLERFVRPDAVRMRWTAATCVVLAGCALGGLVYDVIHPYRDSETRWLMRQAGALLDRVGPGDQLVVVQDYGDVPPLFRWYLESPGRAVRWGGRIDWEALKGDSNRLVTANVWIHRSAATAAPPAFEAPAEHGWSAAEHTPNTKRGDNGEWTFHVDVRR